MLILPDSLKPTPQPPTSSLCAQSCALNPILVPMATSHPLAPLLSLCPSKAAHSVFISHLAQIL